MRIRNLLIALLLAIGIVVPIGFIFNSASASSYTCLHVNGVCGDNRGVSGQVWQTGAYPGNNVSVISEPEAAQARQDFLRTGSNPYRYESAPFGTASGYCVTDPGGNDKLVLRSCGSATNQKFTLTGGKLVNAATGKLVQGFGSNSWLTGTTVGSFWTWYGSTPTTNGVPKYELKALDRSETPQMSSATVKGGSNDGGPSVRQEVWNPQPALKSQDTKVWAPDNWTSTIVAAKGNTEVNSYPDVSDTVTNTAGNPNPVSGYKSLVSTFAENMHPNAATDAEAAYDIWLNDYNNELMIWNDIANRGTNQEQVPAGNDTGKTITVGGNIYHVWNDGANHDTVSLVLDHNAQSGTVDILGVVKALQAMGYYSASAGFDQIDYGFETPSTGGIAETFAVTGYTLKYSL